ncbi:enoyl-CoA hydratase/isomerase family protein [Trichophyton verrucosum HKI 0517]|uniref:Probable enoyl-CoA hydratase, mitochondrial n=1 Tax=Trichophyton verrucosum (strain HKI 0517) TaxID=663202 RepID=D4DGA4_TRIVH|nr:enoyl-CoA hydratase/isomerase family protein [Trichophyton verrucosum HKI 0517]EFE39121.1 enoyl-CoA hydratase/isomerase family protein [Trichophyton verrucosum HKI 0517]
MFARRCSRLVASQTARPLQSYISRFYSTGSPAYEYILTSTPKPGVGLITLNRPKALNALCSPLFKELNEALTKYDEDKSTGAIIITGSEKAFAAGADIKEMTPLTFAAAYNDNFIAPWSHLANTIRTPVIAAVSGYALGGGCELAMMCDMIYCTDKATFGQPEIKLGTIPGAGGSQRLTKLVGKSKAMELILTGNTFSGKEAGQWGVAAKVVEGGKDELMEATLETASKIASYSRVAVVAAKEVVNKSQELSLKEGVEFERRLFHGLFGSKDQKIGMTAFAEKKKPEWSHE